MEKGTHGYISYRKKRQIGFTVLITICAIIIFVAGYLLNDNSRNNIFTIIAVLFSLPGAKMLVGFIVVAPFRNITEEKYKKICKAVDETTRICFDLVLTSTEKVMNLDAVAITDHHVIALLGKEKQDSSYIQTYLARTIKNQGYSMEVKLFSDVDKFILRLKAIQKEQASKAIEENENEEVDNTEQDNVDSPAVAVKKLLLTLNV